MITLGAPLSLSGDAAADGEAIKNGMDLAVADLKDRGIDVVVKYQDDQTDPKQTVSAIRSIGKVDAMVGPTWSFLADAALPVFEQTQTVTIMPANTTEFVQGNNKYAFFGSVKNELKQKPLEEFFVNNNISRVAFIGGQDAWTESHLEPLKKSAESAGVEIVMQERLAYGSGVSSVPVIITEMNNKGVDLVFHSLFDHPAVVKLVNDMSTQNLNIPIIGSDTINRFIYESDPNAFINAENLYSFESSIDDEFSKKYKEQYNTPTPSYSDRGYDAVMILVDAIMNKGDKPLSEYLQNDTDYIGFATTYNFNEQGDIVGGEWLLEPLVK